MKVEVTCFNVPSYVCDWFRDNVDLLIDLMWRYVKLDIVREVHIVATPERVIVDIAGKGLTATLYLRWSGRIKPEEIYRLESIAVKPAITHEIRVPIKE